MVSDYYRRHFASHKIYCGVDRDGKTSKVVWAYTKAEAMKELRKIGFKSVKVFES